MQVKTTKDIGMLIRQKRKSLNLTQQTLAMSCNVGIRFISELENGKPTCEIEKVLNVIFNLGIKIDME